MIKAIKIAYLYVKKHWKVFLSIFVIIAISIASYMARDSVKDLAIARRKLSIEKSKNELNKLQVKKDVLALSREDKKEEISKTEQVISDVNHKIFTDKMEIIKLNSDEKLKKFDDLGY
jgi:uncharacterized protein YlxW (UPF0749 family)